VRIHQGGGALAPPGPAEARTLQRIGAPADIRLACQIRPRHDLSVEPLVPAGDPTVGAERFGAVVTGGREMQVAAMFVDLRESTRLAAGRLPYDVLFLFDRYLQTVTGAIRGQSGHVTSVAGDGVMSIFGVDSKPAAAARCAFHAALNLWEGIDLLNGELAGEFESPLRVGIGLHVGPAVVSCIDGATTSPLQFLGDTGNVAARLEAETKSFGCTLVVSLEALAWAAPGASVETRIVSVRGKDEPMQVAIFTDRAALERMLAAA
jgi:adenylate cyclase